MIKAKTVEINYSRPKCTRGRHLAGEIAFITREEHPLLNSQNSEEVNNIEEHNAVRCRAVELVILFPSVGGYLTLVTSLPDDAAVFETCQNNSQARALCSGIVKLTRMKGT